jgi:hypothetical protein
MIDPSQWKGDGVDHLNINKSAKTAVGRMLSHNHPFVFTHSVLGRFDSIESLWYYVQSEERDHRVRTLRGRALKDHARSLTNVRVTNFRAIILDSNWQKIRQHRNLVSLIRASDLPFDCYHPNGHGALVRPIYTEWLLAGLNEIRSALQDHRTPMFDFLLDVPDSGIYDYINAASELQRLHEYLESEVS